MSVTLKSNHKIECGTDRRYGKCSYFLKSLESVNYAINSEYPICFLANLTNVKNVLLALYAMVLVCC